VDMYPESNQSTLVTDKRGRHHDRRYGQIPSSLSSGQIVEYWIVLLVCRLMCFVTNVCPATRLVSGGSSVQQDVVLGSPQVQRASSE
jgi:hypothetical protein